MKKATHLAKKPTFRWIARVYLSRTIRSNALSPGIAIGSFLGLGSILAAFVPYFISIEKGLSLQETCLLASAVAGVLFVLSTYIGGVIVRNTVNPEQYAELFISGRPLKEVLYFLALKTKKIHRQFEKVIKDFEPLLDELDRVVRSKIEADLGGEEEVEIKDIWQLHNGKDICLDVISNMNKLVVRQHIEFQRLEQMLIKASQELGVPYRRMCNHVIQFTPKLFQNRIIKFKQDLEELILTMDRDLDSSKGMEVSYQLRRMFGIVLQLKKIEKISKQRVRRQNDLIRNLDMYSFIREVAASHSTSGSLLVYANALSTLAKDAIGKINEEGWGGDISDEIYKTIEGRFKMLFRKQKAYPGYDPHEMLIRLFRYALGEGNNGDADQLQHFVEILEQFKNFYEKKGIRLNCFFVPENKLDVFDASISNHKCRIEILFSLRKLSSMYEYTSNYLAIYKERLVDVFSNVVFDVFFSKSKGYNFIVTHGYSKTVRQIIKHGLNAENKDSNYVFLLEGEMDDSFETHLMKFELQRETTHSLRYFKNIAAGSIGILHHLINPSEDRIIILVGAEIYDKLGRVVVEPIGDNNDYLKFRKELEEKFPDVKILTVVAAEGYKGKVETITDSEPFDDHLDDIYILRKEDVDLIITDGEFDPSGEYAELSEKINGFA